MELRFYLDPETGEPHIYQHGVGEDEVEEVLWNQGEARPGKGKTWVTIGSTESGRVLRVIYAPEHSARSLFIMTAYDLRGKALVAYRRRKRRRGRR